MRLKAKDTKKNPRPRIALPRTDHLEAKGTGTSVLQKQQEKRSSKKFFKRSPKEKKVLKLFFWRSPNEENKKCLHKLSARSLAFSNKIFTIRKIVLSSSRGKGNFPGLKASRRKTPKCALEDSLAYAGFSKGGAGNLRIMKTKKKITSISPFFCQI